MLSIDSFTSSQQRHSYINKIIFCIMWIVGMLVGKLSGCKFLIPASFGATLQKGSFVSYITTLTFPLLLSALVMYINKAILIAPILLIKSFLFSATACALLLTYGSAAWLVGFLGFAASFCSSAVLLLFLFRNCDSPRKRLRSEAILFLFINLLIGITDYYVLSPILISSLN